jgi:autotransporter translocation and assembly factor TamB
MAAARPRVAIYRRRGQRAGRAFGVVRVRGTTRHPNTAGALALQNGSVRLVTTGMQLTNVVAAIRLVADTVIIDSISARAGGRILARGGVGIKKITEPSFDIALEADNARVLDNDQGTVRADAKLQVKGPFNRTNITGTLGVRSGVIVVPEPDHKEVISARDPALYQVVDTARVDEGSVGLIEQSPFVSNLRMDVTLAVARDTGAHERGQRRGIHPPDRPLDVRVDRRRQSIVLDGQVETDRGECEFLSKRFQIRRAPRCSWARRRSTRACRSPASTKSNSPRARPSTFACRLVER